MAIMGIFAAFPASHSSAWETIRVYPGNPYIFEFRGQPTVLRTFGESYSSVINANRAYIPYLDVLKRDGMNVTRVWCLGFPPDFAASPADFLQPWPRTTSNGNALDGYGKWDFSAWNEDFFTRLKAFAQAASDRGVVVEFTLFSVFYGNTEWQAGPFHPSNNVQGYGPNNWNDSLRLVDVGLVAAQKAAVRRIVRELNGFDNVYFEIMNEPCWNEPGVKDAQDVAFENEMLATIRDEESTLPNRHLVAHNFPAQSAAMSSDFDIINEHYPVFVPSGVIAGAEALLQNQYFRGKILALDETATITPLQARLESWMFLIGGGAVYNGLDEAHAIFTPEDASGDTTAGNAMRQPVRDLGTYMDRLHLIPLRRDLTWVTGGIPTGANLQASATPGQQYVAYLHHGQKRTWGNQAVYDPIDTANHYVSLKVMLPAGTWRAVWTRPSDMVELGVQEFTHAGGSKTLTQVTYQADVALRIDRTGAGDATPPPSPAGIAAVANDDGSVSLSWNPVHATDLAFYHIYRADAPGVPIDTGHLVGTVSASATIYTDRSITGGTTGFYSVSAVDLSGNESVANRETSVTAVLVSHPFGGTPWNIPGIIQAEDFDTGGQDLAYHDLSPGNGGGQYRETESVDIETTTDEGGGYHVAGTEAGEWISYTVNIATTGKFILDLRASSNAAGAGVHLEIDGSDVTGPISIPDSGGFESWLTITVPDIRLSAGRHILRLGIDANTPLGTAGNVNWFAFTAIPPVGPTAAAGQDLAAIDQNGDGVEIVLPDAGASAQGDAPITSFAWLKAGVRVADGVHPSISLPVGENVMQLVVTDSNGLSATDEMVVRVSARDFLNGGFEANFDGWFTSGNLSIQAPSVYYTPTEGSRLVAFNDHNLAPNGVLSQSFATIPGQTYLLAFDMGVYANNTNQQNLQVSVTGATPLLSQSFSISRNDSATIRWVPVSLTFTTDSTSSIVTFRDISTNTINIDLLLDHVRVAPMIFRTLGVESTPVTGVNVALAPSDNNGNAAGITHFSRVYLNATTVTLTAPSAASGYRFQAWLKDGANPVTSPVVSITMDADCNMTAVYVEAPPLITAQPAGLTVLLGSSATFHVAAEGVGPLSYQWRFNGNPISGAVTDTYTIAHAATEHAGSYDVVVSAAAGSTTSNPATLVVQAEILPNGSFEAGLTGWTTSGNLSIQSTPPYVPTDGTRLVAFNNGSSKPNGVLSRSFATTTGHTYLLAFDMGVYATNLYSQRLQVTVTGTSSLLSQSFSISRNGSANIRWVAVSLSFKANSAASTLTFRDKSTNTNNIDLLLDRVRISDQQTTAIAQAALVPVPQGDLLPAQPSITTSAGKCRVRMAAPEPGQYELQRSRDLKNWETISEISSDAASTLEFIDPDPPEQQMFYRIRLHRGASSE